MKRLPVYLLALAAGAGAFLPAQNPPWPAAWGMNRSTLSMFCNSSGFFDPVLTSSFGIASFDVRVRAPDGWMA